MNNICKRNSDIVDKIADFIRRYLTGFHFTQKC